MIRENPSNAPGLPRRFLMVAAFVALAFLAKFATYGILVTPLWDIPDEPGHYDYAENLSRGQWPVLGQAHFSEETMRSWRGDGVRPGRNWIAQHPPLFYAIDAPVIAMARMAGLGYEGRVRAARLPSAIFGALTILGLTLLLARTTGNPAAALGASILFGATPMFTHLAGGVTHDTLVACTATWGAYWCTRWLQSGAYRYLLYSAAMMGLCSLAKVTALAMAVPFFFAVAWQLWKSADPSGRFRHWVPAIAIVWLLMFAPIASWMVRNLFLFGQILPDASMLSSRERVVIDYFALMREHPFWEHTMLNFVALLGWNGGGEGKLAWIQANGWTARYFLGVIGVAAAIAIIAPLRDRLSRPNWWPYPVLAVVAIVAGTVYATQPLPHLARWTAEALLAAMLATLAYNARGTFRAIPGQWLLFTSAFCVVVFAMIYYHHLWGSYIGTMRATHGRYFYPVVPFLLVVCASAFRGRTMGALLLAASIGALIACDAFYLRQILPLYGHLST
ncbi:hypothetical protein GCM10027359_06830 [Marilutibacter aestuarii]|uniref:Glycosyltransferase family 39 protein n=2 Tax=Marilutibacter aestuarii TaxID=1706195 RepID=A0A507ZPK7_9GAMM|nr:glycosyltransferase family 39 protein [Lysobacter aestuarii]